MTKFAPVKIGFMQKRKKNLAKIYLFKVNVL